LSDKKRRKHTASRAAYPSSPSASRWQIVAVLAAILLVYVALRLPGINIPLDRDEGAFGYIGQLIRDGKLPYRDGLDHKPPVAFYINALALCFVPSTEQGIHLFLLLYNFLTLVCVFYVGKVYFRSLSVGLWSAFAYAVFSASPAIQGFTASTEMYMLLPITLSLLLAILGARRSRPLFLFLSGVAGAAACWTKQTAFTSVLFVFLFVGFISWRRSSDSSAPAALSPIQALGSWMSGAVLFSALPVLYFSIHGILSEFFYWSFEHNVTYSGELSLGIVFERFYVRLAEIVRGDALILGAGVIAGLRLLIKKQSGGYFVLGFLFLSLLGAIPGYGYRHYYAQLAPAAAIAGGCGLSSLGERFRTASGRLSSAVACGVVVVVFPIVMNSRYFLERDPDKICRAYFEGNPFPESKLLAAYVAEQTAPTDGVFVVGSEPEILFYAQRRSPSSLLMAYPLTTNYPRNMEFQDKVWGEIQRNPPKLVLDLVDISGTMMWDGKARLKFFQRMDDLLRRDYEVVAVMIVTATHGGWLAAGSQVPQNAPRIYVCKRKG
jgi:hypothetical protein